MNPRKTADTTAFVSTVATRAPIGLTSPMKSDCPRGHQGQVIGRGDDASCLTCGWAPVGVPAAHETAELWLADVRSEFGRGSQKGRM
jgi:hypothetical protein